MVTQYGGFPGVQVNTAGGSITAVAVGSQEYLVLFGEASYQNDTDFSAGDGNEDPLESGLTGSTETPESINARREADDTFGSDSELANAMREALANGANIDYLRGVAPKRFNVVDEAQANQTGTLNNAPIWEEDVQDESNINALACSDQGGGSLTVEYTYDTDTLSAPSAADTVVVNPFTGEYAADAGPDGTDYQFSYKYFDWQSAIEASAVSNVLNEDDTGVYDFVGEADSVSSTLDAEITDLRSKESKFVNGFCGAEPNTEETVTSDGESLAADHSNYQRRDARFDTANYTTPDANQSVDSDHFFKVAPARLENSSKTVLGGVGGLFAGNPIDDPIFNDTLTGYDTLEQSLTKSEANNLRDVNVIPIRQAGSIRVRDNISTSTATDWERDFWRRRIVDRVIIIAKTIGETIVGRINDEQTRDAAARLIRAEIRELVDDRLLLPNTSDEQRWYVDVYPDATNANEVDIDIGVTPYGVVKRVEENITINTP